MTIHDAIWLWVYAGMGAALISLMVVIWAIWFEHNKDK